MGLKMSVQERLSSVRKVCHSRDTQEKSESEPKKGVPASWKLSTQQQAFIDLFAEPDHKKQ